MSIIRCRACSIVGLLLLGLPMQSPHAQDPQVATAPVFAPASTLRELEQWFRRELPRFGRDKVVTAAADRKSQWTMDYEIAGVSLKECILTFTAMERMVGVNGNMVDDRVTVPMKLLNTATIRAVEKNSSAQFVSSKASYWVVFGAAKDAGTPIAFEKKGYRDKNSPRRNGGAAMITVSDSVSADLLAGALRRTAVLCGAPNVAPTEVVAPTPATAPSGSGAAPGIAATPSDASQPAMSNEDVIKLVSAGLSASVVANAVRQARTNRFDVSPNALLALKKANVPDSVILVMQGGGTAQAPPGAPAAPTVAASPAAPRYDPSLVPERTVAANGCDGIENMGLFENRPLPGAVIYFVKIRNNTSVAKLVTFSFINEYGEEKRRQIQVRGGDIATVDIDVNQKRIIASVRDIRLVACR